MSATEPVSEVSVESSVDELALVVLSSVLVLEVSSFVLAVVLEPLSSEAERPKAGLRRVQALIELRHSISAGMPMAGQFGRPWLKAKLIPEF